MAVWTISLKAGRANQDSCEEADILQVIRYSTHGRLWPKSFKARKPKESSATLACEFIQLLSRSSYRLTGEANHAQERIVQLSSHHLQRENSPYKAEDVDGERW